MVNKELLVRQFRNSITAEQALMIGQLNEENIEEVMESNPAVANATVDGNSSLDAGKDNKVAKLNVKEDNVEEIYKVSKEIQETNCPSLYYGLRSKTFLQLAIMAFCLAMYNYFLLTAWKDIYKEIFGYKD